jgi:transmembrane sensor
MNDDASAPVKPSSVPTPHHDTVLDWARGSGAGELLAGGLDRYLQLRRRRRIAKASGACAVLLMAGLAWLPFRPAVPPSTVLTPDASATILRPEQRTLPDGTTIDLKAGAEIEITFTESLRQVVLRKGEAHFQVAKDAQRPFVVAAGGIEVCAVGTAFAVDFGATAVDVLVTEGRVAVNTTLPSAAANPGATPASSAASPVAALEAGGRVVFGYQASTSAASLPHVSTLSVADIQSRLAWRVPRLKFASTPLAQVVAMFNEHAVAGRDSRLVLASDLPTNVRVSGLLRADDVDSLLRLLAGEFGISAERRDGEIMLRSR